MITCGLRVDSNNAIGSGHITRCINFTKNYKKIKFIFIIKNIHNKYLLELKSLKHKVIFIDKNSSIIKEIKYIKKILLIEKITNLIIDVYDFNKNYLDKLSSNNNNIYLIDPFLNKKLKISNIININNVDINSDLKKYYKLKKTNIISNCQELFIDPYYVNNKNNKNNIKKLIITFGTVDKYNITEKILKIINKNKDYFINFNIIVIIGCYNQKIKKLKKYQKKNLKIIYNPKNLKRYFSNSGIYIGSASMSYYEAIYMRLFPFVINTNKKQNNFLKFINKKKLAIEALNHEDFNEKLFIDKIMSFMKNKYIRYRLKMRIEKFIKNKNNIF